MKHPRLSLGMWDDSDVFFQSKTIRPKALEMMQSHFIDSPWAYNSALPWPGKEYFDGDKLKKKLNFSNLDKWIADWPDARYYFVFANVEAFANSTAAFAGCKIGTSRFNARVGAWANAVADHMRELKLKPSQLGLLLVDEPMNDKQDVIVTKWAKAIKASNAGLTIFTDPRWKRPDKTKSQEAITLADIACPTLDEYLPGGEEVKEYWKQRQLAGQELWFFMCMGPTRTFDPYMYYRLMSWHAFANGAKGVAFWSFVQRATPSSWNEYIASGDPYTPVFIEPDDITDGIHWEAVREGLEDYEYLAMLSDAAKESSDSIFKARAEKLLSEATAAALYDFLKPKSPFLHESRQAPLYDWKIIRIRNTADKYRMKILELLETLP